LADNVEGFAAILTVAPCPGANVVVPEGDRWEGGIAYLFAPSQQHQQAFPVAAAAAAAVSSVNKSHLYMI